MNRNFKANNAYKSNFGQGPRNLSLPATIKCVTCGRVKPNEAFSTLQQQKAVSRKGASCLPCAPGNRTELVCSGCKKTKGLKDFSNQQRKQGTKARCIHCVLHDMDPEAAERKEELGSDDEDDGFTISDTEEGGVDVAEHTSVHGSDGPADVVQQPGRGYRGVVGAASTSSYRGSGASSSSAASTASTAAAPSRVTGGGGFGKSGQYGSPRMPPIENMRLTGAPSSDAGSSKRFAKPQSTSSNIKNNKVTMMTAATPHKDDSDPGSDVSELDSDDW